MSSKDAETLVARYFDAFAARDIAGVVACLNEDVIHDRPGADREIGVEAFERHLIALFQATDHRFDAITVMADKGNLRAAAEYVVVRSDRSGGEEATFPAGTFFEIDDDTLSRITTWFDPDLRSR